MALQNGKYLSDAILNVERGQAFPMPPANFYLALFTAMPSKNDGTGAVEVSGNGYVRQQLPSNTSTWGNPIQQSDGVTEKMATAITLTYPTDATANWGTIVGVGLYDALSGGNLWKYGTLQNAEIVNVGNQLQIAAGALSDQEA